jgi:hypothetical protein
MKKPPIETVELIFLGPAIKRTEVIDLMKAMGFGDTTELVNWRECFPEIANEQIPGIVLRGFRRRDELTQVELAERIGIPQRQISEMERANVPSAKKWPSDWPRF